MSAPKLARAYVSAFRSVLTSVYLLILKFTDPGVENLIRKEILLISTKKQKKLIKIQRIFLKKSFVEERTEATDKPILRTADLLC
jgi:hypothetical protein